jgi:hypothetical protein
MAYRVAAAVVALMISGCASAQQAPQVSSHVIEKADFERAKAECRARTARKEIVTVVAYTQCLDSAELDYLNAIAFPWMDLAYRNYAEHLAVAESIDAGRMSIERGKAEMDASDSKMTYEINRRVAAAGQARSNLDDQQRAATLGIIGGMLAPTPSPAPVYPTHTFCQRVAGGVSCDTQ